MVSQYVLQDKGGVLSLWRRHPLYIHIAAVFLALLLGACATIAWTNYVQGRQIVLSSAEDLLVQLEQRTAADIDHMRTPLFSVINLLSQGPLTNADSFGARFEHVSRLADILKHHDSIAAVYFGYYDGDFFLLRALRDAATRKQFAAPRHAAFLVQSMERKNGARARLILLDSALNTISDATPADYSFDPRTRPWFTQAMKDPELVETPPYVFFTTHEVGKTFARQAPHGRAVVGADLTLNRISLTLAKSRATPSTQIAIFDPKRNVIAFSDPNHMLGSSVDGVPSLPRLSDLSPVLTAAADAPQDGSGIRIIELQGRNWLIRTARIGEVAGEPRFLSSAVPLDELLGEARTALKRNLLVTLLVVVLAVPLVWWTSRRIAANLDALTAFASAMRLLRFDTQVEVRSRVNEINSLGETMQQMRDTIRKFLDISTAFGAEHNFERLLERVMREALDAAGGAGDCIVYLLEDDGRTLKPAAQTRAGPVDAIPSVRMEASHPVAEAARAGAVTRARKFAPGSVSGLESFQGAGLVTVPLRTRNGGAIGVLCIVLPREIDLPSPERLALVEAFTGAGAVSIDNQRLLLAQKTLLNAFIGLIAGAIDAKSAYTGGHCQRVPELTFMLTRAVCDAKEGPFADFGLDEDEWETLHIAGWLHDCGKVTTPEYVVDKATKLETICDRIHEIRTRFEVLKRDAEIACLKAVAAGGNEQELRAALEQERKKLDEEFAFVANSNIGGEFMAPEKIQRLKEIGSRTWQRTLDDRLGVSWEEERRLNRSPARPLPATEQLLADKPEHVIEREAKELMPEGNPWGFRMNVPKYLYNRGELHNLSIARGTLTDEERYKINDHIVQTIIMLEKLPFPPHLKRVPEMAGGHHEKMDGTGYPKRLTREQMSVPARAMAIADIFEALTAADRPYKKAKTLSEAVKIMSFMKKDRHIDPDLFEIFLESGVYLDYARRFMQPQYIDEVDIKAYIGT